MPVDRRKAFALLREAAGAGSVGGMQNLAFAYAHGWGVARSVPKEVRWLRRVVQNGKGAVIWQWGHGSARGMVNGSLDMLGVIYQNGRGVPRDRTRAEAYFKRAAENGSNEGMNDLAWLYQHWPGRPGLESRAISLLRRAASGGYVPAVWNLAWAYQHGLGVPVNLVEARRWYHKARTLLRARVAAGDRVAAEHLGLVYMDGVPREAARARRLFGRLARGGDVKAMLVDAGLELGGIGGPVEKKKALAQLAKVLKRGSPGEKGQAQQLIAKFALQGMLSK